MSRAVLVTLVFVQVASSVCSAFSFLSVGDWGSSEFSRVAGNFHQHALGVPFALLVGDNFYNAGVKSTSDPQWQSTYQTMLSGPNLANTTFLIATGNHDYYGNATAQLEYQDPTGRWTYPALYYDRFEEHDGVKLHVVVLDTWRINGGDTVVKYSPATNKTSLRSLRALDEADGLSPETKRELLERFGGDEQVAAASSSSPQPAGTKAPMSPDGDQQQLDWLREVLSSNVSRECDWRIVVGHFPIHSSLSHGHGDTASLQAELRPLLVELDVDAYIAGHDHILQVINAPGERLVHYGVGAGARTSGELNTGYPGLLTAVPNTLGFMKHHLTRETMTTVLYNELSLEAVRVVQVKPGSFEDGDKAGELVFARPALVTSDGGGNIKKTSLAAVAVLLLVCAWGM